MVLMTQTRSVVNVLVALFAAPAGRCERLHAYQACSAVMGFAVSWSGERVVEDMNYIRFAVLWTDVEGNAGKYFCDQSRSEDEMQCDEEQVCLQTDESMEEAKLRKRAETGWMAHNSTPRKQNIFPPRPLLFFPPCTNPQAHMRDLTRFRTLCLLALCSGLALLSRLVRMSFSVRLPACRGEFWVDAFQCAATMCGLFPPIACAPVLAWQLQLRFPICVVVQPGFPPRPLPLRPSPQALQLTCVHCERSVCGVVSFCALFSALTLLSRLVCMSFSVRLPACRGTGEGTERRFVTALARNQDFCKPFIIQKRQGRENPRKAEENRRWDSEYKFSSANYELVLW
ncbi:hypothetical protein CBR_g23664 [Chara braunii]|uniref:Uncharacterized protein n=1 Tax=Chara braunii TaxID=69332 RepID=A0A388L562_CHABU|nr:hypothetical protein CBR_g23664 [Chara braunii]|eukprot:GBG77333.1 hypothetical protein CBR_g23664 [Chara braunii]